VLCDQATELFVRRRGYYHTRETHCIYRLAAVNFFLGCVGITQVTRILLHQRNAKAATMSETIKDDVVDVRNTASDTAKSAKDTVKEVLK
jgi:hypothetical protein